jgi:hypothetical protein
MRLEIDPAQRRKAAPDCLAQVRLGALIELTASLTIARSSASIERPAVIR